MTDEIQMAKYANKLENSSSAEGSILFWDSNFILNFWMFFAKERWYLKFPVITKDYGTLKLELVGILFPILNFVILLIYRRRHCSL
jgi:hypothetical protein